MARIVITRPNGETEYAELTTDKAQAGNDRLAVEKAGTTYYAKLDSGVSTHMFVIKPDGRKLYVQKEVKFVWKYDLGDTWENATKIIIPRTGKYRLIYSQEGTLHGKKLEDYKNRDVIIKQGAKFSYRSSGYLSIDTIEVATNKPAQFAAFNKWDINSNNRGQTQLRVIEYIGEA